MENFDLLDQDISLSKNKSLLGQHQFYKVIAEIPSLDAYVHIINAELIHPH